MRLHHITRLCLVLPLLLLSSGCGVTGGTHSRKIALNPALTGVPLARSVQIGDVSARPGAGVNHAIGAYNLGKFGDSDLATLRESVRRSLPASAQTGASVHIVVQHFGLTFTNNRGAGLAIVDWCAAERSKVLASERFYAAYDTGDKIFGTETIGAVKNRILHAAAARIAERALAAANALPPPPAPALTFEDPAAASATLPAHMVAVAGPGLVSAAVQQTMLGGLAGATNLLPDPLPPSVAWNARLNKADAP